MTVRDICTCLEEFAPLAFQESWDNSGLAVGWPQQEVRKVLITLDINEAVVKEAMACGAQMIVGHHPVTLSGVRRLTGADEAERTLMAAVAGQIAIYVAHTNMDTAEGGVSHRMAQKLGLSNIRVLACRGNTLQKLVAYIPKAFLSEVREALFAAGAGHVGNYDCCGFETEGNGMFRALPGTNPFAGKPGERHTEAEIRFETVFPSHLQSGVIAALLKTHPYEEVAYDIYGLRNSHQQTGLGVTGWLPAPVDEQAFLRLLKEVFHTPVLRHTCLRGKNIRKVALCGGSGSSLLPDALSSRADIYVTADFKYHQFADAGKDILVADIGHFESEQFTKEIFYDILTKKNPTFAVQFSQVNTNPISYL
ncbi:MAG: Nif3-like dinuclear metal center hexameric protein [Bacteroidales bacterium]|jgi:dinuclear metal center YbgI/SA1388 family protein|nr:Nif3-like dinuclear metal center hexameric protein [Bacteroidales bacterium]